MKRIGIVTLYYKSNNYGANLQAFALAKYISNLDNCIAEQISVCFQGYEKKAKDTTASQTRLNKLVQMSRHPLICCKKIVRVIARQFSPNRINEIVKKIIKKLNKKNFDKRTSAVIDFNQNIIPHSKKVYTENNIGECGTNYDIFITGSDQVWSWCSNTFLLSFVEGKKKFSYAASISRIEISENHKQFIKDRIKAAISTG